MNHIRRTLVAVAASLALFNLGAAGAADGPGKGVTINIGYFPVVSPVPIMRTQHLLEDKGYTVNWVPITQGLPGAASAVAAGQLDIAWGNSISAVVIFSQSPDAAQFIGQSFINANVTVVVDEEQHQERQGHRRQEGRRQRHEDGIDAVLPDRAQEGRRRSDGERILRLRHRPRHGRRARFGRRGSRRRLRSLRRGHGAEEDRPRALHRLRRHRPRGARRRLHRKHQVHQGAPGGGEGPVARAVRRDRLHQVEPERSVQVDGRVREGRRGRRPLLVRART